MPAAIRWIRAQALASLRAAVRYGRRDRADERPEEEGAAPAMAVSGSPGARPHTYVTQETWAPAPYARRSAAWLLDVALLVVVVLAIAAVLGLTESKQVALDETDGSTITTVSYIPTQWYYALLALASPLYAIPLWRLKRATLGQRLLDLRVVDAEAPNTLSWRQAALRWLLLFGWVFPGIGSGYAAVTWFFTVPFLAWFVVLIVTAWRDPRGQGIHDHLARSLVEKRQVYKLRAPKSAADPDAPAPSSASGPRGSSPTGASRGPRRSTRARRARD